MGRNRPVTDAERQDWRRRYLEGKTQEEIALDVGRKPDTIRKHLRALNTPIRRGPAPGTVYRLRQVFDGVPGETSGIKRVAARRQWRGHRRRKQY